jgi:peptidoglycan/xylan/chitin deacetylase (PgdA/CDA1 family)
MSQHSPQHYIVGLALLLVVIIFIWNEKEQSKNIVYSVATDQKIVALTFDDGPHPIYTPQLLDILSKYHVKATFFMVGASMKRYPLIVKQVVAKGHSLGNHTYTHPLNLTVYPKTKIIQELSKGEVTISRFVRKPVFIFRPPRGRLNQKVIRTATLKGYKIILWSICGDKRRLKSPESMARRVTQNIHAGDIILLHDGTFDSRWKDVEATDLIIGILLKKGYRFVTVPELLGYENFLGGKH